ncbi:hypothetical protein [Paenibacillus flagellatus]|uniref:Extracellular solute-binding protein n=1 Tax=Paenibacillus flagellatus TaxID=2211139 RepID=A0A2V5KGK8_9BACL|nr:hypothetical protein [Paenibacillus flagellatus]PYI57513.1 hypothetical protein DLM86_03525 [Paenibacillus flagellatus]
MKARSWKIGVAAAVLALLVAVTAACGGPKADVSVFMMFPQNSPFNKQDELKTALQAKVGEAPTVDVSVSPMFELQKMIVELAAGDHGVFVLPKEQFDNFKKDDGFVPLDDVLKKEDFPEGVHNDKLIGIPLKDSKLLKDAGYKGEEVFAFITVRVKEQEKAKQVLKAMAER